MCSTTRAPTTRCRRNKPDGFDVVSAMDTIRTGVRALFTTVLLAVLAIVLIVVVLPAILAAAGAGAG